jgi:hypothetical protein
MIDVASILAGQLVPYFFRFLFSIIAMLPAVNTAKPPKSSSERMSPFGGTWPRAQSRKPQSTGWRVTATIAPGSPPPRRAVVENGLRLRSPASTRNSPIGAAMNVTHPCQAAGVQSSK